MDVWFQLIEKIVAIDVCVLQCPYIQMNLKAVVVSMSYVQI